MKWCVELSCKYGFFDGRKSFYKVLKRDLQRWHSSENQKTINNVSPICLQHVLLKQAEKTCPFIRFETFLFRQWNIFISSVPKAFSLQPILHAEFVPFFWACNRLPARNNDRGSPAVKKLYLNFANPSVMGIPHI